MTQDPVALDLTLAMTHYDHVVDLARGDARVEGVNLRVLELPVEEVFHRFLHFREWELSELSLAKYVSLISQGDDSMVGLPVFPSRVLRHSGIYVRAGELSDPVQLRGKRLGIAEGCRSSGGTRFGVEADDWSCGEDAGVFVSGVVDALLFLVEVPG
ncbi:MAG: hypothetical protein ACRDQA_12250, partial [Nocardioidaceae bacterium]